MSKTIVSICVLAALVSGPSAPVAADTGLHTRFTFSEPIAFPGVTLPAGTYTFRLVDATSGGRVVQVLDEHGTRTYAMLLSIPASRPLDSRESAVSFMETAPGMPAAVKVWWQEGSAFGHEFVYPREQELRLTRGRVPEATIAVARSSPPASARIARRSPAFAKGAEQTGPAPFSPADALESPSAPDQPTRSPRANALAFMAVLGALILLCGAWLRRKARV